MSVVGINKKNVIWGAGRKCDDYLKHGLNLAPQFIIDSDSKKSGNIFNGIIVKSPDEIKDWSTYFVIVISQYEKEIFEQLRSKGLIYKEDYIGIKDLNNQKVSMDLVNKALQEVLFENQKEKEIFQVVRNRNEYEELRKINGSHTKLEKILSKIYYNLPGKVGTYRGYCEACNEEVDFVVDYYWSKGLEPLWRETITCPVCNCNSRMRFIVEYIKKNYSNSKIFCYEKVTDTYKQLEKYVSDLTGSEYLSDDLKSGEIQNGIMHQDCMNLSFSDESFDVVVSNDVFEHVTDFKKAFMEAYRSLKNGGRMLFSIPFFKDRDDSIIRARLNGDKSIEYILSPEYHGNPLSEEGSLVFTEFGWDVLEELKKCGFVDAYAITYFSVEKGLMGDMQICFEAVKQVGNE